MNNFKRRGFLVGAAGTAVALTGCLDAVTGQDETFLEEHADGLEVSIEGDGPEEPVELTVIAQEVDFFHVLHPGEDLSITQGEPPHRVEITAEYDDEIEVEVEIEIDEIELEIDIEQDVWLRTAIEAGLTPDEQAITFDAAVAVELPESTTNVDIADEREMDEWEYDIEVEVGDDGDDTDVEFEVELDS